MDKGMETSQLQLIWAYHRITNALLYASTTNGVSLFDSKHPLCIARNQIRAELDLDNLPYYTSTKDVIQ